MSNCITCGRELHPDRAKKYDYCMAPECQEKNAKGLTMVAIGVNKAAEQYMILDETTKGELASGKYRDQRRELFGTPGPSPAPAPVVTRSPRPKPQAPAPQAKREPWSRSQEKLALLYNEQGVRPDEIAQKLGLSTYLVTQIILNKRSRGKL
jgi:hypothetical protein